MKKWSSLVLALALLIAPAFVTAQPVAAPKAAASESACCCCSPEKEHSDTASCQCDGCARKNASNCGCVQPAPVSAALPAISVSMFELPFAGGIYISIALFSGRSDPPLLRPPIFS